jgi:CheY-like chemotaxis protein
MAFSRVMLDVARDHSFKGLVTSSGAAALALVQEHNPVALTLDLRLPDIDGWRVLDRIKSDLATRHLPVFVISTEDERARARRQGAAGFVHKPIGTSEALNQVFVTISAFVERQKKTLLVLDRDAARREAMLAQIGEQDIEVQAADSAAAALEIIRAEPVDCVVVGKELTDLSPLDFVERLSQEEYGVDVPVIAYHRTTPTADEESQLKRLAQVANVRRVRSPERLLDQASLFLHRPVALLPEERHVTLRGLHDNEVSLAGKHVMVVDDDIRNIFALTSLLERENMNVVSAETGRDAIRLLQQRPNIDVMLLDIMMPEMDGIDTMRAIRKQPQFASLPIVAVTAKAMKGDREKCIEAGAWDYLSKPVDPDQLFSILRFWCRR